MAETIFYLEGRAGIFIFHFMVYNLGGLYYIMNEKYNVRGNPNTSVLLEDIKNKNIVNYPSNSIKYPIKIYMKDIIPFQREAFEIIKDKFELVEELPKDKSYEIVSIYGEPTSNSVVCDNPDIIFPFLRNLFLEKMDYKIIPGKRIFITRNGTQNGPHGKLKRTILNENELQPVFNKYNIEYVQLEKYSMHEKIKLFMESEVIVSSHSGSLTFSLFFLMVKPLSNSP